VRVVSLLPCGTEIVCALGARRSLVGRSHECDFPLDVVELPALTRSRIGSQRSSLEIDRAARDAIHDDVPIYDIDLDLLRALEPDVIVTQDLCSVCAPSFADVRAAASTLSNDVRIVSLGPKRLDDIWTDILRTADALDVRDAGLRLVKELKTRVDEIARRAARMSVRPSVFSVEWIEPIIVSGLWMPELIALAGGSPLMTRSGGPAYRPSQEQLEELDPDVVLVKPCGLSLARAMQEEEVVRAALCSAAARAREDARLVVTDGNAFFNRSGPRIVESLEILAASIHPATFGDLAEKHRASFTSSPFARENIRVEHGKINQASAAR
jgi:iron complex transport system substrate-binding protein